MNKVENDVGNQFAQFTSKGLAVVDFWANWCGPCRMLAPVLDRVALSMDDVAFGKVNVDDYPELARSFNIVSIPNVCIFKDGELVDRIIGLRGDKEIVDIIAKHR